MIKNAPRPRGRPPRAAPHIHVSVRLEAHEIAALNALAARRGVARSDLLREAVARLIAEGREVKPWE